MKMLFKSVDDFLASLKASDIHKPKGVDLKQIIEINRVQRSISGDLAIKAVDDKSRTIKGIINALHVDRDGEVLIPKGCLYTDYMKNPIVLMNHMTYDLPVANTKELEVSENEIVATMKFLLKDENPIAEHAWLLYSREHMRAFSHSFLPWEWTERPIFEGQQGRTILKWELLEVSCVTVQSLREALVTHVGKMWELDEQKAVAALSKALDVKPLVIGVDLADSTKRDTTVVVTGGLVPNGKIPVLATNESILPVELVQSMRKILVGNYTKAAIGERWKWSAKDANTIIEKYGFGLFKSCHAWTNNGLPVGDFRSASYLPHHKLFGNELKVVFRGVKACMCGLLSSVVIYEKDRDEVYKHLADHWREFGSEPPSNKLIAERSIEWKQYFNDLDEGELKGALVPWEDALVPPYIARVIEFPSLEAAVTRINIDLKEAQVELIKGRAISSINLKKLQDTLAAMNTVVSELNKVLAANVPYNSSTVQELKTVLDIMEIGDGVASAISVLDKFNQIRT